MKTFPDRYSAARHQRNKEDELSGLIFGTSTEFSGSAQGGIRTHDQLVKSQLLYH
jgi:hypothetical protein